MTTTTETTDTRSPSSEADLQSAIEADTAFVDINGTRYQVVEYSAWKKEPMNLYSLDDRHWGRANNRWRDAVIAI